VRRACQDFPLTKKSAKGDLQRLRELSTISNGSITLTIPALLLRSVRRFSKENNERLRLSGFLIITLC
jgi:hypothetical protein